MVGKTFSLLELREQTDITVNTKMRGITIMILPLPTKNVALVYTTNDFCTAAICSNRINMTL